MNEFARKAMELADLFENAGRRWASAAPQNAYRVKEERDELRAALVAHLEGAEQKAIRPPSRDHFHAMHIAHCNSGEYEGSCKYGHDDCPALPATPTEEQSQ